MLLLSSEFGGRCRLLAEAVRTVTLVLADRSKYRDFNLAALRDKRLLQEVLHFLTVRELTPSIRPHFSTIYYHITAMLMIIHSHAMC